MDRWRCVKGAKKKIVRSQLRVITLWAALFFFRIEHEQKHRIFVDRVQPTVLRDVGRSLFGVGRIVAQVTTSFNWWRMSGQQNQTGYFGWNVLQNVPAEGTCFPVRAFKSIICLRSDHIARGQPWLIMPSNMEVGSVCVSRGHRGVLVLLHFCDALPRIRKPGLQPLKAKSRNGKRQRRKRKGPGGRKRGRGAEPAEVEGQIE